MDNARVAHIIKQSAKDVGFDFCGISKAGFLEEQAPILEKWLSNGMHGSMRYMENHFDKRLDPTKLMEGSKTVVSLLYNYYTQDQVETSLGLKISKYALGEDYHTVIKEKLYEYLDKLRSHLGHIEGRVFVDSAPVMDKVWAAKSGCGWIGKHSNLINRQIGSFFFIAELIIDIEAEPDAPVPDYCGTCTRCIDACPTDAIVEPYIVDGSKCISYFTIELKEAIPTGFEGKFDNWIFGCDICQDVCPWNRFKKKTTEQRFYPIQDIFDLKKEDWEAMNEQTFNEIFGKSALKRAKLKGLKRNINYALQPL
jgi:epoxyqueuosine reductase